MSATTLPRSPSAHSDATLAKQREADLMMCSMPEISPPIVRACRLPGDGCRLNLVIPVLSDKLSFAGMVTAQRLFRKMAEHFEFARIIVTHESFGPEALAQWPGWTVGEGSFSKQSMLFLGRTDEPTLTVAKNDFFIATSWTAAMFIKSARSQQRTLLATEPRRYVYLIQEYEPLFYPASPQYCLAEATYQNAQDMIAVFNTKALADYFARRGHNFPHSFIHEPMLHPTLEAQRVAHRDTLKSRQIFLYARPAFLRNGFRLLVEGVKHWAKTYPEAGQWSIVSAGGKHPRLYLPQGVTIEPLQKLTLDEYAGVLARTWVGLSLSFSAHPGQVIHEVAEFGAWSITNACETRQPAAMAPNVVALEELSPEGIAATLSWCCSRFQPERAAVIEGEHRIFRSSGAEFEFIDALVSQWK